VKKIIPLWLASLLVALVFFSGGVRAEDHPAPASKADQLLDSLFATREFKEVAISPDGRWLAYAARETNRFEIYVQAFPSPGGKYQISTDGGAEPVWAKNGCELFYRNGDKMTAVSIEAKGDSLEAGTPKPLFEGRFAVSNTSGGDAWYDVSPDGQRFLMLKTEDAPNSTASIVMVQDWMTELKRLVPGK